MRDSENLEWPEQIFEKLLTAGISILSFIPDAGNTRLVDLAEKNNNIKTVLLTTEEEGIAICAGADLVGKKGVVCMQSSGVGNCPNFLSLVKAGKFPIFIIISMRGDYGEQNPWQYPMGQAVEPILKAMGVLPFWVNQKSDLSGATDAALSAVFKSGQSAGLILSQKFLGAKPF